MLAWAYGRRLKTGGGQQVAPRVRPAARGDNVARGHEQPGAEDARADCAPRVKVSIGINKKLTKNEQIWVWVCTHSTRPHGARAPSAPRPSGWPARRRRRPAGRTRFGAPLLRRQNYDPRFIFFYQQAMTSARVVPTQRTRSGHEHEDARRGGCERGAPYQVQVSISLSFYYRKKISMSPVALPYKLPAAATSRAEAKAARGSRRGDSAKR